MCRGDIAKELQSSLDATLVELANEKDASKRLMQRLSQVGVGVGEGEGVGVGVSVGVGSLLWKECLGVCVYVCMCVCVCGYLYVGT